MKFKKNVKVKALFLRFGMTLGFLMSSAEALATSDPSFMKLPEGVVPVPASRFSVGAAAFVSPDEFRPDEAKLDFLVEKIKEAEKGVRDQIARAPLIAESTRVLFLGVTGAGKSTLLHAVAGKKLTVKDGELEVGPGELLPGSAVGGGLSSVTTLPISWYDEEKNIFYWDCPGFGDSRGAVQDIINAFAVSNIFEAPSRVKTVLVIQQSEITDGRMSNAMQRFETLKKIFVDISQLQESLSVVVTKVRERFDPVSRIQRLVGDEEKSGREVHPLLSFLVTRPDVVFSFPEPLASMPNGAEYSLFADRLALIRSLQSRPIVNPRYNLNLGPSEIVYVVGMRKRLDNLGQLISSFVDQMQREYRTKELEDLELWKGFTHSLSGSLGREISPIQLADLLKSVPSVSPLFKDISERIKGTHHIASFVKMICEKSGVGGVIEPQDIGETLRPFLDSMASELGNLIEGKRLINEQKQRTEEVKNALDELKVESDRKEEEQKKKLEDMEMRTRAEKDALELRLEEEVRAGKLAREDAERRLSEYATQAAEDKKKVQEEFARRTEELNEQMVRMEEDKAEAMKKLREVQEQTEQKIAAVQEEGKRAIDSAIKDVRRQAAQEKEELEARLKKTQEEAAEAAKKSREAGDRGGLGGGFIAVGQDRFGRLYGLTPRGWIGPLS